MKWAEGIMFLAANERSKKGEQAAEGSRKSRRNHFNILE